MTVPKLNPTINDLDELARSPHFRLTLDGASLFSKQMMNATDGIYKTFGDSFRKDPTLLMNNNAFESITNILEKKAVNLQAIAIII